MPAAERFGLIHSVDRWIVKRALTQLARLHMQGESVRFSINLSGLSVGRQDMYELIEREVREAGVEPSRITFEITETAVIANLGLAIDFIGRMKQMGCMFALDDFGSGLSSFAYLKKLPVDFIKIDGEFVRDIATDPMDRAIVSAINDIGHEIGLTTVAEYVESPEIVRLLKICGVDKVQGNYISEPLDKLPSSNVIKLRQQGRQVIS